ncbi:MAG TPA: glycosyltransferase [Anaerolineaceae bacterium]|nr:glycosyltransferase [Anaerolineaceae bacterium]
MNIYLAVKVRNEIDIIELFLSHIDGLFDKVYLLDHKSKDGTSEVLRQAVEQRNTWDYTFLDFHGHFHQLVSNFIMEKAFSEGADYLVFLDADEFLYIKDRKDLERRLTELDGFEGVGKFHWRDVSPVDFNNHTISEDTEVWLSPYRSDYQKVTVSREFYDATNKTLTVSEGNHEALDSLQRIVKTKDIGDMLHIPLRSVSQLEKKTIIQTISYLAVKNRNPVWGTHIFERLEALSNNELVTSNLSRVYPTFVNFTQADFLDKGFLHCSMAELGVHFSSALRINKGNPPNLAAVVADALMNFQTEDLEKVELYLDVNVMKIKEVDSSLQTPIKKNDASIRTRLKNLPLLRLPRSYKHAKAKSLIEKSALFDAHWYTAKYPDVPGTGLDPLNHYLRYGAVEGRNPSASFNASRYLKENPDVKMSGINPLQHYLEFGINESREIFPVTERWNDEKISGVNFLENNQPFTASSSDSLRAATDIVICVHNAREDANACLTSVLEYMRPQDRVILVNDSSDEETVSLLQELTRSHPDQIELVNTPHRYFITRALNLGLSHCTADYIVALDSDTVVGKGWIEKLINVSLLNDRIGIVSCLSNAADNQSILQQMTGDDEVITKALFPNSSLEEINRYCETWSGKNGHAIVPYLYGFCTLMNRKVLEKTGGFDEMVYHVGFGAAADFCLRAQDAGFLSVVATDTYITHKLSKSFDVDATERQINDAVNFLKHKYGHERVLSAQKSLRNNPVLNQLREDIKKELD